MKTKQRLTTYCTGKAKLILLMMTLFIVSCSNEETDLKAEPIQKIEETEDIINDGVSSKGLKEFGISAGWYYVHNFNASYKLEVYDDKTGNGANVVITWSDGDPHQKWYIKPIGNGVYTFRNDNSRKYLDVQKDKSTNYAQNNGANVQVWQGGNSSNQKWRFYADDNGAVYIKNVLSGKYLGVKGGSTAHNANVLQWDIDYKANQQWGFY